MTKNEASTSPRKIIASTVVRRANGGIATKTGLRAGRAKTADKAFQAMDAYIRS